MFKGLFFLATSLLLCQTLSADPWGKDADLANNPQNTSQERKTSVFNPIAVAGIEMIRFHQVVISPSDGPRSHYYPSSSQYTLEAMKKYGFFCGWILGCDRLMRENSDPWVYRYVKSDGLIMKSDPVWDGGK